MCYSLYCGIIFLYPKQERETKDFRIFNALETDVWYDGERVELKRGFLNQSVRLE